MRGKSIGKAVVNIFVVLCCCIYLFPVYLIIVNAFKSRAELYENILAFPKEFTLEYFKGALDKMDFVLAFKNSIIVTVISVAIIVSFKSSDRDYADSLSDDNDAFDAGNEYVRKDLRGCV